MLKALITFFIVDTPSEFKHSRRYVGDTHFEYRHSLCDVVDMSSDSKRLLHDINDVSSKPRTGSPFWLPLLPISGSYLLAPSLVLPTDPLTTPFLLAPLPNSTSTL